MHEREYHPNLGKQMPTREELYGKHRSFRTVPTEEYEKLLTCEIKLEIATKALEQIKNAPQNKCATKNICKDCLKITNKDFECEYVIADKALTEISGVEPCKA